MLLSGDLAIPAPLPTEGGPHVVPTSSDQGRPRSTTTIIIIIIFIHISISIIISMIIMMIIITHIIIIIMIIAMQARRPSSGDLAIQPKRATRPGARFVCFSSPPSPPLGSFLPFFPNKFSLPPPFPPLPLLSLRR